MDRTLRAALVAGVIGLVLVGGTALFLGIDIAPALISGLVAGALFAGLILAAARRADSMTAGRDDPGSRRDQVPGGPRGPRDDSPNDSSE